jgi:hypothetical protein
MFSFLKIKKQESRGFNYKPQYYDAEKENLLSRIREKQKEEETASNNDTNGEMIKMRIRDEFQIAKISARRNQIGLWQGSNLRLIAIMIALLCISYFILNRFLPVFLSMLFPNG